MVERQGRGASPARGRMPPTLGTRGRRCPGRPNREWMQQSRCCIPGGRTGTEARQQEKRSHQGRGRVRARGGVRAQGGAEPEEGHESEAGYEHE